MTAATGTPLDSRAHALTVFRAVSDTEARQYTATTFPRDPYQSCERMIRMARAVGYLTEATSGAPCPYAVLDVLAEDGDIVQDFLIPNVRAFRWWYRALNLRVVPDDDDDRSGSQRGAGAAALTAWSRYADRPSSRGRSGGGHHAVLDQDLPPGYRLRRRRGDALCKPGAVLGSLTNPRASSPVTCARCLDLADRYGVTIIVETTP